MCFTFCGYRCDIARIYGKWYYCLRINDCEVFCNVIETINENPNMHKCFIRELLALIYEAELSMN